MVSLFALATKPYEFFAEDIKKSFPKGSKILFVGDSSSEFYSYLDSGFFSLSILHLGNSSESFSADSLSFESLSGMRESFDILVLFDVLSSLEDSRKVLEDFYASLKESGKMYISVKNIAFLQDETKETKNHSSLYDARKWKYIFEMNSLIVERNFTFSVSGSYLNAFRYLGLPFVPQGEKVGFILLKSKRGCRRNSDFLEDSIKI